MFDRTPELCVAPTDGIQSAANVDGRTGWADSGVGTETNDSGDRGRRRGAVLGDRGAVRYPVQRRLSLAGAECGPGFGPALRCLGGCGRTRAVALLSGFERFRGQGVRGNAGPGHRFRADGVPAGPAGGTVRDTRGLAPDRGLAGGRLPQRQPDLLEFVRGAPARRSRPARRPRCNDPLDACRARPAEISGHPLSAPIGC